MDPDARYDEDNKCSLGWSRRTKHNQRLSLLLFVKNIASLGQAAWGMAHCEEDYTSEWLGESERTESHKRAM